MKKFLLPLAVMSFIGPLSPAQEIPDQRDGQTALILIDIQMFYFPGGRAELVDPELAAGQAGKILAAFRKMGMPVVHVQHQSTAGEEIHPLVAPAEGEKVITKQEVNAFHKTELHSYLKENMISRLVIAGMQTHMCLEAAARAAHDLGFECTVIGDACATRNLSFDGETIPARLVHLSTLSTLNRTYASIMTTKQFLELLAEEK